MRGNVHKVQFNAA